MGIEGLTYQNTITMITEACCNCGVAFGTPSDLHYQLKADSDHWFYCPNGHRQHYSKSTSVILQEKLDAKEREHNRILEVANNRMLDEMNARKKAERKLKKVMAGVCPCCTRTFSNLEKHIQSKHPEHTQKLSVSQIHKKINNKVKK